MSMICCLEMYKYPALLVFYNYFLISVAFICWHHWHVTDCSDKKQYLWLAVDVHVDTRWYLRPLLRWQSFPKSIKTTVHVPPAEWSIMVSLWRLLHPTKYTKALAIPVRMFIHELLVRARTLLWLYNASKRFSDSPQKQTKDNTMIFTSSSIVYA